MKYPTIIPTALLILLTFLTYGTASAESSAAKGHHEMMQAGHHGYTSGRSGQHKSRWKKTLTDKQRSKIRALKLGYMKTKYPLKAKKKALKTDLALMVMADKSDSKAMDKKIDALLAIKKQMMKLKYMYKISVRKELTAEQRVLFDIRMLKKAMRGKKHKSRY